MNFYLYIIANYLRLNSNSNFFFFILFHPSSQTSLPSLILDLLTVSNGKYESQLIRKLYEILNCGQNVMISNENIFSKNSNFFHLAQCDFPGSKILQMINDFEEINKRVDDFLYDLTVHKAWLTRYNFAHNITSPWRINEGK